MFVLTLLFTGSLVFLSRNHQLTNHRMSGDTPAEQSEARKTTSLEETLRKKIAELENDVQAANDDSTAWMELYHEQEAKSRSQSRAIETASTSLGSRLTYLDLKAQVKSLEIKCNWQGAQLRDSDSSITMMKKCEKQRQGKDRLVISNLQGRVRDLLRHERQHVPTPLQTTELQREKAESANLRHSIAQKDESLRTATKNISRLEEESADNKVHSNKAKDELNEKLIQMNREINKLQDAAAKDKASFKTHLEQQLSGKDEEIERITGVSDHKSKEVERLKQEVTRLEACESNLNTSLSKAQTERDASQASSKSMEKQLKELEIAHEKCSQFRTPEIMPPPPSGLAPAASEGMDVDSPFQLLAENQKQELNSQRQQINSLEDSIKNLRSRVQSSMDKNEDHEMSDVSTTGWREQSIIDAQQEELIELREKVNELRCGDHDMSDAFAFDTQEGIAERLREVTESHSQTVNMLNGQLASLQEENKRLEALVDQNGSLKSGGGGMVDAKIARLGKEKDAMNTELQKARKLTETIKKERDQLRDVKAKINYEKGELVKIQEKNIGELEKLKVEKTTLVEKCASLEKDVEESQRRREEEKKLEETGKETGEKTREETREDTSRPNRKRSAPDDGEEEAIDKRVKTDDSESSNA